MELGLTGPAAGRLPVGSPEPGLTLVVQAAARVQARATAASRPAVGVALGFRIVSLRMWPPRFNNTVIVSNNSAAAAATQATENV